MLLGLYMQRMVDGVLQNQSYFEEVVEQYSGPGRYTAKQENEDLEEIASTLPSDVGPAAQAFVQRSLTTLKVSAIVCVYIYIYIYIYISINLKG
jgi:hypothetical protein